MSKKNLVFKILLYILLLIGVIVIIFPIYVTIVTAFKTTEESASNFFALPSSFYLDNFKRVMSDSNFKYYIGNSVFITVAVVGIIVVFIPLVAYAISRNMDKRYYRFIYNYFLFSLFMPFQVLMVPLTQFCTKLGILNQYGLIVIYITYALGQGVFLFVGYYKSVPLELEEAAHMDGCSILKTFFMIVYPIVKPMTATVGILNTLWVWNDFLLPLLILNRKASNWTLPLYQYNFKSTYSFDYNLAFASFMFSIVPMIIIYIFLQRYIIEGLTAGAVKS